MSEMIKYTSSEIDQIVLLNKSQRVKVKCDENIIAKGGFYKKDKLKKGVILEFSSNQLSRFDLRLKIRALVSNKNIDIETEEAFIEGIHGKLTQTGGRRYLKLRILSFNSVGLNRQKKYYFRNIIPLKADFDFYNIIEDERFAYDNCISRGLVSFKIEQKNVHCFVVKKLGKRYLFIDCCSNIFLKDFLTLSWEVSIALGYLLGQLVQDEGYIFAYNESNFKTYSGFIYKQYRDSIKQLYTPIHANPHAWINDYASAKPYFGKINVINSTQLSNLCNIIHNEQNIKSIIVLITESISRSLLLMPAGLSVALEGLAEFFYSKNEDKINPITKKQTARLLRNDLMESIKKYAAIEEVDFEIIEKKIQNINTPTNSDKLKAPFKILGIPITKLDEEILDYRNDFLHGNINLNPRKGKKSYSMDSFEISLRLMTLLNMCIMKMIGYEGYIINHVKMQEEGLNKFIEEDYYRMI